MRKKRVLTILGIRPDIIRLAFLIKRLDADPFIDHFVLTTGQHFDSNLTDEIYKDLDLRKPDHNLEIGKYGRPYNEQISELFLKLPDYLKRVNPDMVVTLGDTNSVCCSTILRREANRVGFKIARIEAGMRTHKWELPEECNRVQADSVADYFFCYHEENKNNLLREGKSDGQIFIVGNTIVEPVKYIIHKEGKDFKKGDSQILVDIHREENVDSLKRLSEIIESLHKFKNSKIKILGYPRFLAKTEQFDIKLPKNADIIELQSYSNYLKLQYSCWGIISDSGSCRNA